MFVASRLRSSRSSTGEPHERFSSVFAVRTLLLCLLAIRPKKYMCVSGFKLKKLGMAGRNNILFCQNILFSRWYQYWEAVRKTTWNTIDSIQYYHTTDRYEAHIYLSIYLSILSQPRKEDIRTGAQRHRAKKKEIIKSRIGKVIKLKLCYRRG